MALLCLAATATTQHQLLELLFDAGDAGQQAFDEEAADASYLHNGAMLMAQMGLLLVASEPFSRKGVTYAVGPERYSFERIERQFGNTASCKAVFRFELPDLKRLYAALDFPEVVWTHNAHATGEEVFLYMLKRLSYPCTLTSLAWESGRNVPAQSELFHYGIRHIYNNFKHLRDNRSLGCWAGFCSSHSSRRV